MNLDSYVKELKGVGEKTEKQLEKIGVYTVRDILLHFPNNYIIYPEPISVSEFEEDTTLAIKGEVITTPYYKGGPMQMVTAQISDGNKSLPVVWFHMPYIKNSIHKGESYIFYGKVRNKNGRITMDQPVVFSEEEYVKKQQTLQPLYRLAEGISNNLFTKLVRQVITCADMMVDGLSEEIRNRRNLISISEAIENSHFPATMDDLIEARRRLAFDEFFNFLLRLELTKTESVKTKFCMIGHEKVLECAKNLAFTLTKDQNQALQDILHDMSSEVPMQRLLQGDVGSGKTILAFLAMLYASMNGTQSALMVPTEVLAMQHFEKLTAFCKEHAPFTNVYILTGSMSAAKKREIKQKISLDPSAMIVGTHALIVEDVEFCNLSLVITDEQHRFGVKQRETFSEKGLVPHVLVMSATPIPRTLAIILYGDLDVSVIKALPLNRLPIKNCVVKKNYRKTAYEFIRKQVMEGHQAYVICPLVEESEAVDAVDAVSYAKKLEEYYVQNKNGITPTIGLLHGKLKNQQKNEIMEHFAKGELQILVSTTVVEVGVDVPNATVMMVENAERFGLAQLHQLRGRVGRGGAQSYCIFVDGKNDKVPNKRLEILNTSNDGFYIAEQDLKLRGPGDVFGIRQSGEMDFQIADIYHDAELLKDASWEAKRILSIDPDFKMPIHSDLLKTLNL